MKKFLTLILALVILTMAVVPAMAEDAAVEIVPLQAQIDAIAQDFPEIYSMLNGMPLAGTWHPILTVFGGLPIDSTTAKSTEELAEAFNPDNLELGSSVRSIITLNEDGTAEVTNRETGEVQEAIATIVLDDSKTYFVIELTDKETGDFLQGEIYYRLYWDTDDMDWLDTIALMSMVGGGVPVLFYNEECGMPFVPAVELTPVVAGSDVLNKILEVGKIWELADTNVGNRSMRYNYENIRGLSRGNVLEFTGDPQGDTFKFEIDCDYEDNWIGEVIGMTEDGTIQVRLCYYYKKGDTNELYGEIRLHEDGLMTLEWDHVTDIYKVYTIDPLTEYTDKATIKAVQMAMNSEGFECGTPDGIAGKKTAAAVTGYQAANGLTETGTITYELLESLRTKGYDL